MVDLVNEENADLVVIAGDIFTSSYEGMSDPDRYAEILRGMKAKNGVYAVYGNHDVEETLFGGFPISPISQAFRTKQMEDFFDNAGFITLYDEVVTIEDEIQLAGRVDGEKAGDGTADRMSAAELLKDIDPEKPVLVLEHEPIDYAHLNESGADLVLSGHTHAGQIFPGNLVVPFFNENAYGYKVFDGLQTIVTSGVGYYGPPMRVGTDSEVTVVNITFNGGE
jgi:predicted MPP superfamily phosphohydrolase